MPEPHPFRRAAETKDLDLLSETLTEDVVLHSPILFKGFEGREMTMVVLANVIEVFEDFRYLDEVHGDGTVVLRFAAKVDGKFEIEGIDYLTLEEVGRTFGVTRERIRQIENNTLKKLKRLPEAQMLREAS